MFIRIFAVFSVLATQLALLYLAGFLQNWTPIGIDVSSGTDTAPGVALAFDFIILLAFGLVHSALARPAVKQALYGRFNHAMNRSIYNLVAAAQLAFVVYAWQPLPQTLWQVDSPFGTDLILAVYLFGHSFLVWAIFSIDPWHFFGLRQAFGKDQMIKQFIVRGPYRLVRHPIQSGLILALWATPHMTLGHAMLAAFFTAYSLIATLMLEERDLRGEFGQDYARYSERVPAFLPRLWRARQPGQSGSA